MMTESDKLFAMMKYCDERNPKPVTIALLIHQLQGYLEYLQRAKGENFGLEDASTWEKENAGDPETKLVHRVLNKKINSAHHMELCVELGAS